MPDAIGVRIKPLALSNAARAALECRTPVLRAMYRHGFSLAIPGSDEDLYLGTPGHGLLPLHIVVRRDDLQRIRAAASRAGTALQVPVALSVATVGVRVFSPRLPPDPMGMRSPRASANLAALAHGLRTTTTPLGLGVPAVALLAQDGWVMQTVAAVLGAAPGSEDAVLALIGRGAGSTPAGDDMLVGMLAYAWATAGECAPLVTLLRGLADRLPALTTRASVGYLRAATRGEFGSHLIALVRRLPSGARAHVLSLAERVARHGASSGVDTLCGLIAASEAAAGVAPDAVGDHAAAGYS